MVAPRRIACALVVMTSSVLVCAVAFSPLVESRFIQRLQTVTDEAMHRPTLNTAPVTAPPKARLASDVPQVPLYFEQNQGQTSGDVKYMARGGGFNLYLTGREAVLALTRVVTDENDDAVNETLSFEHDARDVEANFKHRRQVRYETEVVSLKLAGNVRPSRVEGGERLAGTVNYFIGDDATQWRANIPTFRQVRYPEVYAGVDLVYYGNSQRQLEYDFIVQPHADPNQIKLTITGAERLHVAETGDLVLTTKQGGELLQRKPLVYQQTAHGRKEINSRYVINRKREVTFKVDEYDTSQPLIIDPILSYSSYLGGNGADSVAVDASGNIYVAGVVFEANFAPTGDAIGTTQSGASDGFVFKFTPSGNELVYATYLGGTSGDEVLRVVADASGNAYLSGYSNGTFPTTNGALQTQPSGGSDAFAAKLNPAGNALLFSTLFGGSGDDFGFGIGFDAASNVYLTGHTTSPNLRTTTNAFQTLKQAGQDTFAAKLNGSGGTLIYSTFIGGDGNEDTRGFASDANGNVYLAGLTTSTNYPTQAALQTARTDLGVYASFDRATAFSQIGAIPDRVIYSLLFAPNDNDIAFAGTSSGIFRTLNGGQTITKLNLEATFVRALSSSANGNAIFAGALEGVFRSTDGGTTWTRVLNERNVRAVVVAPSNPNTVYAGGNTANGVFRSTDGGTTWTPINTGLPASSTALALAVNPTNANHVFAAINGRGMFASTNGGASWTAINNGLSVTNQDATTFLTPNTMAIDRTNPSTIYIGITNNGVYKTTNGGASWTASNNGLTFINQQGGTSARTVRAIAIDSLNNQIIYAGTNVGVFRSTDAGASWQATNNGLRVPNILSLAVSTEPGQTTPVLLAGVFGDVDATVTKLNSTGSALVYSTYLAGVGSGNSDDGAQAIAVDASGAAYVTGFTLSSDFPTTAGAVKTTHPIFEQDGFVTKYNPAGSSVVYSTYLGGNAGSEVASGIAVDAQGNAHIFGQTSATDFPTANAFQNQRAGNRDFFVTKLNSTATNYLYSTYLGGTNTENIFGQGGNIALDARDNAYVVGQTNSTNYPVTDDAQFSFPFGSSNNVVQQTVMSKISDTGNSHTVAGRIVNRDTGRGLADVFVSLVSDSSEFFRFTRTDEQGFYQLVGIPPGTYLIVSGEGNFRFEPERRTVVITTADVRGQDFIAVPVFALQGRITATNNSNLGISNVTVTLSGTTVSGANINLTFVTDANGFYFFTDLERGNYVITPSRTSATNTAYTFTPTSQTFNNLNASQVANFTTDSAQFFSITGRVTNASGATLSNVLISLNGVRHATVRTDSNGNFSFTNLQEGESYVLTAQAQGTSFTPARFEFPPLTSNVSNANFTSLAPTGLTGKIAFARTSPNGGNEDIFIINADTTNPVNITNTPDDDERQPAWSPDGSRLAFIRDSDGEEDDDTEIYVMNADGSNVVQLTDNDFDDIQPSFSPDNNQIAFTRRTADASDIGRIWIMNANGTNQRQLTTPTNAEDGSPSFSPDGARIIFLRQTDTVSANIFTMNADGSNQQLLASFPSTATSSVFISKPIYSPDGSRIAFDLSETTLSSDISIGFKSNIWAMNADGTNRINITRAPDGEQNFEPTWSPDSRRLAFSSSLNLFTDASNFFSIVSINADGTERVQITNPPSVQNNFGDDFEPAWQPTGGGQSPTLTISGRITESPNGNAVSGVTVTLNGTSNLTTTTDASGDYSFANLAANGNYTVTPTRENFTFTPPAATFNNLQANQIANFTANRITADLSIALTEAPDPVTVGATLTYSATISNAGANIARTVQLDFSLSETAELVSTDGATCAGFVSNNLRCTLGDIANGTARVITLRVRPLQPGTLTATTSVSSTTFDPNAANNTAQTSTLVNAANAIRIAGRITDENNNALANVAVTLREARDTITIASTVTNASGAYLFESVAAGRNYTITPSSTALTFTPSTRTLNEPQLDQLTQNFVARRRTINQPPAGTLRLTGRIADANNNSLPNVFVALSGAVSAVTTTDANGTYSFVNLANGSYTLAASAFGFSFAPAQTSVTLNNNNANVNFVAAIDDNPPVQQPPRDGFTDPTTTARQFTPGTLTQAGNFNPQVTVQIANNQLEITPVALSNQPAFNGLVSSRAIDLTDTPNVEVEVKQAATGDGAQTIFALGSNAANFFRFVVSDAAAVANLTANATVARQATSHDTVRPLDSATQQLTFQVVQNNQLFTTGITYNPTLHRFWRFRNDAVKQQVLFETSPDAQTWTLQFPKAGEDYPPYAFGSASALASELAAGTLRATANPGKAIFDNYAVSDPPGIGFITATLNAFEGNDATVTVTRNGEASSTATVRYETADGTARGGTDYLPASGTLLFASGERSKTFTVKLLTNTATEEKSFDIILREPIGTTLLSGKEVVTFTINDKDDSRRPNPIDTADFLLRQQIFDLFTRVVPNNFVATTTTARSRLPRLATRRPRPSANVPSVNAKQLASIAALFTGQEFEANSFVARTYRLAFGRNATFAEALGDLPLVSVGILRRDNTLNTQIFARNKQAYTDDFTMRAAFVNLYGNLGATEYVDTLYRNAGITNPTPNERAALILGLITRRETRASVLRRIADNRTFVDLERHRSILLFAYFDFYRRDPEATDFNTRLARLNASSSLVASGILQEFLTSREYRSRFGRF